MTLYSCVWCYSAYTIGYIPAQVLPNDAQSSIQRTSRGKTFIEKIGSAHPKLKRLSQFKEVSLKFNLAPNDLINYMPLCN